MNHLLGIPGSSVDEVWRQLSHDIGCKGRSGQDSRTAEARAGQCGFLLLPVAGIKEKIMLKKTFVLLLIFLSVTTSVLCSCDKNAPPTRSTENENELVGTWATTQLTIITSDTTVLAENRLNQIEGVEGTLINPG